MNSKIEFEIIDNLSDLYNLKKSWIEVCNNLEEEEIFYQWIWIETYIKEVEKEKLNPFVIVGKKKGQVIVIAPLCLEYKGFGIFRKKILRFIIDTTADYQCILIRKGYNQYSILKHLFEEIVINNSFDIIKLNNISCREKQVILIEDILRRFNDKFICYKKINKIAPYIKLNEFQCYINKKRYKSVIKKEKNVDNNKLINININSYWNEELWNKFVEIHKSTWKDSVLKNKNYINFYSALYQKLYINGKFEFSYATYEGEIIAGEMVFKCNDKVCLYNAFNNVIGRNFSMGDILLKKIIEYYKDKYEIFDLLLGNEEYKFYLTDSAINICDYTIISKKNYILRLLKKVKELLN